MWSRRDYFNALFCAAFAAKGRGRGNGTSSGGIAGTSSPCSGTPSAAAVSGSLACASTGGGGLANVPFANLVIVAARLEIEVDVLFVIAVGAWAEHGRKPRAGGRADGVPPILIDVHVGETKLAAVGELEIVHVERIGAAVLAHLCGVHVIAAAAIIGREIVEPAQRRQVFQRRRNILAHPIGDRLRHRAA